MKALDFDKQQNKRQMNSSVGDIKYPIPKCEARRDEHGQTIMVQ